MLTVDFGDALFALVYATIRGGITEGFQPNIYGTKASIIGAMFGDIDLKQPYDFPPHVNGEHCTMDEYHVFEDMIQLTDWMRDGVRPITTLEQARHVIEIIEAGYTAAETGRTQALHTSFTPLPVEALGE